MVTHIARVWINWVRSPILLVVSLTAKIWGNGQKREYPVLFWPKTDVPENNSGREYCWPYLIGQPPLSPVLGQKRPAIPGNSYFAQLPPVFGHFMFLSGGLPDCSKRSIWATRTIKPYGGLHEAVARPT